MIFKAIDLNEEQPGREQLLVQRMAERKARHLVPNSLGYSLGHRVLALLKLLEFQDCSPRSFASYWYFRSHTFRRANRKTIRRISPRYHQ